MSDNETVTGGYFRMPNSWLLLPLSPGAKTLLAYFCSQARNHGVSYNSFKQLGEIVGRAKSTVCGYVKELRDAGLVRAQEQKRRDGSNYRLKIFIVGWSDIVGQMGTKKDAKSARNSTDDNAQPTERPVRPAERSDPKGHKTTNYKNNTTPNRFALSAAKQIANPVRECVWSSEDQKEWSKFRDDPKAPFYNHGSQLPEPSLVQRMKARAAYLEAKTGMFETAAMDNHISAQVEIFIEANRIRADRAKLEEFSKAVRQKCLSTFEVDAFFTALNDTWNASWRQISTPQQVIATYEAADIKQHRPKGLLADELAVVRNHLRSYDYASKKLRQ